jgi:eukaryotic translation initiation factor 2C
LQVRKIENETERASQLKTTPGSKRPVVDPRLPLRPGYGTQGREVTLWANYFELVAPPDLLLFRYSIEILPDDAGRKPTGKKARRIVELLLEEHLFIHRSSIATDYKSNLVCRFELPIDHDPYSVRYRSEEEDEPSQNAKTYRIRLQDTGTLRVSELMDYLTSVQTSVLFGSKEEIIQALNIVIGYYPKTASNIFSVGANKHFELSQHGLETRSLGAGLQAIRGFFISVRAATSRILVNVQVKHTAYYDEGPLERLISLYLDQNGRNVVKLGNFLKKVRIRVTHIIRRNKKGDEIPRIKTVVGLATPGDGYGLAHPPIVPRFAAGTKEVKFFLGGAGEQPGGKEQGPVKREAKRGKKGAKSGPEPPQGGYISVYDFFQRCNYLHTPVSYKMSLAHTFSRPQHYRKGSKYSRCQCGYSAESLVFACRCLYRSIRSTFRGEIES